MQRAQLSREQCLAFVGRMNADPEMREILARPDPTCPRGTTLAALGAPYRLAGVDVPPPALSGVARLGLLGSPLLSGADEVTCSDAWRALWALTCPASELSSLYGLDARCDAIRRGCTIAKLPPETAIQLVAETEGAAHAPIDAAALAMAGHYPGATAQQAAGLVGEMLADIMAAFARAPKPDQEEAEPDQENPQRPAAASMATGWLTSRYRWLRRAWALWRGLRMYPRRVSA